MLSVHVSASDKEDVTFNDSDHSLDDLRSVHSNSNEEVVTYPEFNDDVDMVDPVLEVGLKFRSKKEVKGVVKNFSIHNRFEVVFPYNDRCRLEGCCKEKNCPWRIWVSPLEEDSSWQIKLFEWNHTYSRALKNISVSASCASDKEDVTFNDSDHNLGKEDDIFFQENVTQNIELDIRNEIVSLEAAYESENSEYDPQMTFEAFILIQFAYSQPTTVAGLEQGVAPHFLSKPKPRPGASGSSNSTPTLSEAWNNLMTK
ncbi:unnamed protein product [Fraxinus pennsylvanica]|uniref:Transposase MuDR plant domain-containing protein n=1 Tax=Fraxinus pennsylvanica TaxID=56036 RepID=A0AAD2DR06_9LAMI|nr:unnamed protein product [Fraxinus pennsylvanica]